MNNARFARPARIAAWAVAAGLVVTAVAGCDQAQPPPTVIVNNPPADGGQLVLVPVMIAVAFVVAVVAVVCAWGWASERRARREAEAACRAAEDVVLAVTGQPIAHVRPALFTTSAQTVWTARIGRGEPPAGGEVAGWSE